MKKSIVKRIGSLLTVLLLTASIFSNGLVAFAADTKHTQSKVLDWSYNFEGSGLKNAYDPLTGGNTNFLTATSSHSSTKNGQKQKVLIISRLKW